jgi:plasmid maintenance system antidote protein VapI
LLDSLINPTELPLYGLLRQRGVAQWKLARDLGVPESRINRILRGIDRVPEELQEKLTELERELSIPPPPQIVYRRGAP